MPTFDNVPENLADFPPNSILIGNVTNPKISIHNSITNVVSISPFLETPEYSKAVYSIDAKSDYSKFMFGRSSTPYLIVVDSITGAIDAPTLAYAGAIYGIEVTPDDATIIVCQGGGDVVTFYNSTTYAQEASLGTIPSGTAYDAAITPDGTKLAVITSSGDRLYTYSYPAKVQQSAAAQLPPSTPKSVEYSKNGQWLVVACSNATHPFLIYDATTLNHIQPTLADNSDFSQAEQARFSDDSSKLAICGYNHIRVYETTTWTVIASHDLTVPSSSPRIIAMEWINAHELVFGHNYDESVRKFNINTLLVSTISCMYGIKALFVFNKSMYQVVCSIVEDLVESKWTAVAIDYNSGAKVGAVDFDGANFTIQMSTPNPVLLVVYPRGIKNWQASKTYQLGDKVHPTNPTSTPFYYKCTTAGTSGATEPSWSAASGSMTGDGSVVWTQQEGIIKPQANLPIIPTPV